MDEYVRDAFQAEGIEGIKKISIAYDISDYQSNINKYCKLKREELRKKVQN